MVVPAYELRESEIRSYLVKWASITVAIAPPKTRRGSLSHSRKEGTCEHVISIDLT